MATVPPASRFFSDRTGNRISLIVPPPSIGRAGPAGECNDLWCRHLRTPPPRAVSWPRAVVEPCRLLLVRVRWLRGTALRSRPRRRPGCGRPWIRHSRGGRSIWRGRIDLERTPLAWWSAACQANQLGGVFCGADLCDQGFKPCTRQHQIDEHEQRTDQDQHREPKGSVGPETGDHEHEVCDDEQHHNQDVDNLDDRRGNEFPEVEIEKGFHCFACFLMPLRTMMPRLPNKSPLDKSIHPDFPSIAPSLGNRQNTSSASMWSPATPADLRLVAGRGPLPCHDAPPETAFPVFAAPLPAGCRPRMGK